MSGRWRRASEPVPPPSGKVAAGSALGRSSKPRPHLFARTHPKEIPMLRKFAVALIATTMLVAPALAADAVKSTPAAPAAAATTSAPVDASKSHAKADTKAGVKSDAKTVTKTDVKTDTKSVTGTAPKSVTKTDKEVKTIKVAHSHHVRHMTFAKAKVSKPAAPAMTWFQWTAPKTEKHVKVAHHHVHHMIVA